MAEIDNLADELEALRGGMGDDHMLALRKMNGRASFMDRHFDEILDALRNRNPPQQYPAELAERMVAVVRHCAATGCEVSRSILAELPNVDPDETMAREIAKEYGAEDASPILAAIKRVRAEKGGMMGSQWQPIGTAPKDGTHVIGGWPRMSRSFMPLVIYWDGEDWNTRDKIGLTDPTHWMPLPTPPDAS